MKQSTDKLKERINQISDNTDSLITATGMPSYTAQAPPLHLLDNLIKECEDHVFWLNFKKAAPMLFCALMEHNEGVKSVRDMSFMEELLKVKSLSMLIKQKLEGGDADIDLIEFSIATQMLETKLRVL